MQINAQQGAALFEAIKHAGKNDVLVSIKDGGLAVVSKEVLAATTTKVDLKWKRGSEESQTVLRTFLRELTGLAETKVTQKNVTGLMKQLASKTVDLKMLKSVAIKLDTNYERTKGLGSKIKEKWTELKFAIKLKISELGDNKTNKEIRLNEIAALKEHYKNLGNDSGPVVKKQVEEQKVDEPEAQTVGTDKFLEELKAKQKEFEPKIEKRWHSNDEQKVDSQPSQKDSFIEELKSKQKVVRPEIEKRWGSENNQSETPKFALSEQERKNVLDVLFKVAPNGIDEVEEGSTETETQEIATQEDRTETIGERLSNQEINQLADVLKEIAPNGLDEVEEGSTETETQEMATQEDQTETIGESLSNQEINQLVDVLKEIAPEGLEEVETESSEHDDYVDLRSGEESKDAIGPSKGEIDKLAEILSQARTQPTRAEINELVEQLTPKDK